MIPKRLRLAHKGLLLVSVPLICEIIFVGVLGLLLHSAELEAERQARAKLLVGTTSALQNTMYEAIVIFMYYAANKADEVGERFDKILTRIPTHLKQIEALSQSRPELRKKFPELKAAAEAGCDLLKEGKDGLDEGGRKLGDMRAIENRQRILSTALNSLAMAREFTDLATKLEKFDPTRMERLRYQIVIWMVTGIIFSIVMASLIALFFVRDIAERVKTVRDNSSRLSSGITLIPPVKGDDEIKELDVVFRQMADRLQEIEQMKQEFVAMLSHDLRSPLTALQVFLSGLGRGHYGDLNKDATEKLTSSQKNLARLIGLINDLLDLDKLAEGKLELERKSVFLSDLLVDAKNLVEALAIDKAIRVEIEETDLELDVDEEKMVRLIANLLSNAIKFSPAGSTIDVTAREVDGQAEVHVIDKGPGLDPAEKELVFERFYQSRAEGVPKAASSGLGLAICRAVTLAHGGTIGVDSTPGQGADFWFRIPLTKQI